MLGSGSGPIFGSDLGSGRFRVGPNPTDLLKKKKKKTNVSERVEGGFFLF